MITKNKFITIINDYKKWFEQVDKASEALGIPTLFESNLIDYSNKLFDILLDTIFNKYGVDDINWWIYEKSGNPDLKMWDKEGNEIPTETIDDLWEIVKENCK